MDWLDELLDDATPEDRARLEHVHERLLAAGPPPELPPSLQAPPEPPRAQVIPIRRHRYTAAAAAAVLVLAVFGAGYVVGGARAPDAPVRTVAMTGVDASATLDLFDKDAAGNWPMSLTVSGLPALPEDGLYELWLTQDGKLAAPCGTFAVEGETTEVRLNAPFRLRQFTGWAVTRAGDDEFLLRTETV
jgi:hypothetical protein